MNINNKLTNNQGKFLSELSSLLAKHDASITIETDWGEYVGMNIKCSGASLDVGCTKKLSSTEIRSALRQYGNRGE